MMWLLLAFLSAALLGFYDVFKKQCGYSGIISEYVVL